MLKKIAMGTALATLIAVPAFAAQSNVLHYRTIDSAQANYTNAVSRGSNAYAYAPAALNRSERVYVNGKFVGQDPDPNVRLQLRQDSQLSY